MDFSRSARVRLIKAENHNTTDDQGKNFSWLELDFVDLEQPGVFKASSTVDKLGNPEAGKDYTGHFEPKAQMSPRGARISDRCKCLKLTPIKAA